MVVAESPGVAGLAAHPAALPRFWAGVAERGTPLLEPAGPGRHTATFLWRGDAATTNVLLLANRLADRDDLAPSLMRHVPGTDVWHLTYLLPDDYRGSYQIAVDEAAHTEPPDNAYWQRLMAAARTDPFNPRTLPTGRSGRASSIMELPDAPVQPWNAPSGAPEGEVVEHRFTSEILGNERSLWVYRPRPGGAIAATAGTDGTDDGTGGLPLLVLLDGNLWFPLLDFRHTTDNLIAAGRIPPMLVVGVDAIDVPTRRRELGGDPRFRGFLRTELMPWARRRLGATRDPAQTVVAGQSFGALAGLDAPDLFGGVLCQSPSLWRAPETVDAYAAADTRLRLHLSVGRYEGAMVADTRALTGVLRDRGIEVTHTEYTGGHDFVCWRGCMAEGLAALASRPTR
ncbi:enterochelin esterase family protein [Murinocardiopsis flavida]|uniref:Enterochelin esterase family protein n=1 Tax=Murinocardiopsis flavida TaxID=645275 RepID=A0A2P8DS61_9ACTN|nr:enterochelin esterase family protein [Murinocardiopsis flavida]